MAMDTAINSNKICPPATRWTWSEVSPPAAVPDNQNEGHNGAVISEIANYAQASLPMRPNVVLVHAGTNDMNQPNDPDNAPARLGSLIDEIVSICPDAAVLVAKIIPASNSATMSRIDQFNAAVPGVVAQRADAGKKVMVVDFSTGLTTGDLTDGLHPTDGGYIKMADIWFSGIQQARDKGWIKAPVQGASFAGGACSGKLVWMPQNEIASGPGFQSGGFKSTWIPKDEVASGIGKGSGVRFGDIDGDGRDDYLWVDDDGSVVHYLNTGTGEVPVWVPQGKIASGIGKDGAGVRFADMDGDGKDDYLWVSEDGKVTCFLNRAGDSPGKPTWVGIGEIASGTGAGRDRILFADLDGDGRDDYLVVGDNGQISAWYNTGNSEKPVWIPSEGFASGIGAAAGVRLGDINNDGRADYLWLSEEGALTVFLNGGTGRTPKWLSQGVIATGVGTSRENITFADLNGDGKVDYLAITAETGAVKMWLNAGSGSATETGDGVMFADLNGALPANAPLPNQTDTSNSKKAINATITSGLMRREPSPRTLTAGACPEVHRSGCHKE
jgi:lysophospholipase L1-like esterase